MNAYQNAYQRQAQHLNDMNLAPGLASDVAINVALTAMEHILGGPDQIPHQLRLLADYVEQQWSDPQWSDTIQ
ncbi:MAG: hypothetical protein ACJAVT_000941 [Yoonia sp.]|jgi:hypothetical protein